MKNVKKLVFAAFILVASCSSDGKPSESVAMGKAVFASFKQQGAQEHIDVRSQLTREMIDNAKMEMIFTEIPSRSAAASMARVFSDTKGELWFGGDGTAIRTAHGSLIETRGLGSDLMAADFVPSFVIGAKYSKKMEYLESSNDPFEIEFNCEITAAQKERVEIFERQFVTTHFSEVCQNEYITYTNEYWIDLLGIARKSKQWQGNAVGYLLIEQLN